MKIYKVLDVEIYNRLYNVYKHEQQSGSRAEEQSVSQPSEESERGEKQCACTLLANQLHSADGRGSETNSAELQHGAGIPSRWSSFEQVVSELKRRKRRRR